ncbi:MAG: helix-turn-helix domain-containing protein [Polyangiaceae bacterium]
MSQQLFLDMPRARATTLTLHKSLDARQVDVQARVLRVARRLIRRHGHEMVGMEQVARAAGVSRATMYRYFTSKEHLVCEAALAWGHELARSLSERIGAAAHGAPLDEVVERIVAEAESNLPMVRATMASVLATGPVAEQFRVGVREMFRALLAGALGVSSSSAGEPMPESLTLLGRVFFADLALLGAGDLTAAECVLELKAAARRLMMGQQ